MTIRYDDTTISWFGYACIRVELPTGTVVYTDPGRYGTLDGSWASQYGGMAHPSGPAYAPRDGDLVLVTHDHHYEGDGIERVAAPDGTVVLFEAIDHDRIRDNGREVADPATLDQTVIRVSTGETLTEAGVAVDVIPASNDPGGPNIDAAGDPIHPQGFGCGFRFAGDGTSFFWPGDSDVLAPHHDLAVDVFVPSIASNYTMDRHDAAALTESLDPGLVLPIHYNTFDALRADSRAFAGDVAGRGTPVVLDERGLHDAPGS